jgi:arylsulfatase A-like enzyme
VFGGKQPRQRRMAYGGYANWCYALTDGWKLISENRGRARRLYDVRGDPRETRNVAASNGARWASCTTLSCGAPGQAAGLSLEAVDTRT